MLRRPITPHGASLGALLGSGSGRSAPAALARHGLPAYADVESRGSVRMKARSKPLKRRPVGAAAVIDETRTSLEGAAPIVERPDGFYWISPAGRQQFGPFASAEAARANRDLADDEAPEPGASLREAEDEIGIADWIDPDTGEPAEGRTVPRLSSD